MNSPFSNKTYVKLFLAQIISLAGTGITTIALALLAWQLAKDNASVVLGIALSLKMLAYVFFAPLVSTFANRVSKRKLLFALDIFRALLILYFPFITTVWEIYVLLFLINLASATFTPVFQATIADIIKDETAYKKALSYSRLAYDLEQLLSPSLAAFLLLFFSFSSLFYLDSITFVVSAILILFTKITYIKKQEKEKFFKKALFGISAYFKTPRLKALFFLYIIVSLVSAMMITNTVVIVNDFFNKGESETAFAMAFAGFGSMLVALLISKLYYRFSLRTTVLLGGFVLVATLFLASLEFIWFGFLSLWFIFGVGLSLVQVPAGLLVRLSSSKDDLVSYFSANFSLSHLCWMFAYPLTGFITLEFGLSSSFLVLGFISTIALIVAIKIYPNPDVLEIEHSHESLDELHHEELNHTNKSYVHKHKFVIDKNHKVWPK